MRRIATRAAFCGVLAAGALGGPAAAQDAKAKDDGGKAAVAAVKPPESLVFEKTGKMPAVKFSHAAHAKKLACKECHEGEKPLFPQKFDNTTGLKMADIYAGQTCGACHNGKKAFAAKAGCMKCHNVKKGEAAAKAR